MKIEPVFTPLPRVHSENHLEWLIDDASAASFPASDPSAIAQPHAQREGRDGSGGEGRAGAFPVAASQAARSIPVGGAARSSNRIP